MANIKLNIRCRNIAPLKNLDGTFDNNSLQLGIYASNGSGKTFISRMFRLLEVSKDDPNNTDRLITMGMSNAEFGLSITDGGGVSLEDIRINLNKGEVPSIPNHNYIYHTFNQDYVDDNIRALDFEHTEDVQGYILGKTNIDLTEDKKKLEAIENERNKLYTDISSKINNYVGDTLSSIRDIRRLAEYSKYISAEVFLNNGVSLKQVLPKRIDDYIVDYNKVKAVPEGLVDIEVAPLVTLDDSFFEEVNHYLETAFTLSHFAEAFKNDVRNKQGFIEEGLSLLRDRRDKCPFCGQRLHEDALSLIDQYNAYLSDEESRTIKRIQDLIKLIKDKSKELETVRAKMDAMANQYNDYKTKYIPSCEEFSIQTIDVKESIKLLDLFKQSLEEKQQKISSRISFDYESAGRVKSIIKSINETIEKGNDLVADINRKKNTAGEESRTVRRSICKATYNHWIEEFGEDQTRYVKLANDAKALQEEITKKQELEKVAKKGEVAKTIKQVLDYFFSGKYTLDSDSFRLIFNSTRLEKDQTKNVLSEGEKSIVAFAYYLGDTHTLIERDEDYDKLFFIIDDPISSMDFTYVYTLSGVIRDMKKLFPKMNKHLRQLVLTHNSDFIRILSSNNILGKVMLLKGDNLTECRDNYTVPYINHLLDIFRIARCGEKASHTTANSIRHIIETINRFEVIDNNDNSLKAFIEDRMGDDKKIHTYINDLSHGGWRTDQEPMTDDDYKAVCEAVISMIQNSYPMQIDYCERLVKY